MGVYNTLLLVVVLTIAGSVGCFLKGKLFCALGGLFGLLATPIGPIVVLVGMCRLAHPGSWWAKRFYGAYQLDRARVRFGLPTSGDVPPATSWPRPRDEG